MYSRLAEGKPLYKNLLVQQFGVSLRSVQRDIDDLRVFFSEQSKVDGIVRELIYDRTMKGYRVVPPLNNLLDNDEVFAVLKILLESRAFAKNELMPIIDKLIACCVPPEEKRQVMDLISNEKHHYIEPQHKRKILKTIWRLGTAIKERRQIVIKYQKMDGKLVTRIVQPVGIMFSEFYFYLTAFIVPNDNEKIQYVVENDPFPTIYRIDRIRALEITDKTFTVPYANRFEEGEFRKRVQFMYGGRLQKIKFYYRGKSIEAVLDRLPTAQVVKRDEAEYLVTAEVFGKGIEMWLRSQGDDVEVLGNTKERDADV